MIDHIGFPVADYARSTAFYTKALAPLGYVLITEVQQDENDSPAAGFGANGKPDFWIGGEGGLNRAMHVAIAASDRAAVDARHRAALADQRLWQDQADRAERDERWQRRSGRAAKEPARRSRVFDL